MDDVPPMRPPLDLRQSTDTITLAVAPYGFVCAQVIAGASSACREPQVCRIRRIDTLWLIDMLCIGKHQAYATG